MRNKHLHIFRRLLFISFCLCSIMIGAQNPLFYGTSNRQMQMEMNTHLSIIDSVANVCSQEVSAIRNDVDTLKHGWEDLLNDVANLRTEMDTLTNKTCIFLNNKTKEPNWDKRSVIWTIGSIFVMIVIFVLTSQILFS